MPTISKIQLPNGNIYDLSTVKYVYILDNAENSNATFNITDFTGAVTLITGTEEDFLLTIQSPGTAQLLYPVGSLYATESSTDNPATILGFGTWVKYAPADLTFDDTDLDWNNTVGVTSGIYVWKRTA